MNREDFDQYQIKNDQLVNIKTGEVIDSISEIQDYQKIKEQIWKLESGLTVRHYTKDYFTKIFKVDELIGGNDDVYIYGILFLFALNLNVIENSIQLSNDDICSMLKISHTKLKEIFLYMENKKMILRKGRGKNRVIYINPYIMINGNNISYRVKNLFL